MLWLWWRCSSRVHSAAGCTRLFLSAEGSLHVVCLAEYCSGHPTAKGTTCRRLNAWTNPLGVAHTGSRAACSPPVRLGHLGRTLDMVSGVHVRPGQRCSETPSGGTAPDGTLWLETTSALRALKSQRAVLLPMARTGFGPWSRVLSGPYRLAVLRQATSPKCSKSAFSAPGVLLLPGNTLGYCSIQKGELASSAPIRYPPPLTRARPSTTSCRAFMPWTITF